MDIEVKEFAAPKIVINYDALKIELEKTLSEYKGLIVTSETLDGCKAAQKELASLRVKVDTYRKDKKKEIEKPIKAFENQCKELIALIEAAENPIKDGIKIFDDQKREEKRNKAIELANEAAAAVGLNEKYAARLDILDKYTNLTATAKAVREDLETRAFALKVEQDREADRLQIINDVLDSENLRINTKIRIDIWQRDIEGGTPTADIIYKIKAQADMIYNAENKPTEPVTEQQPTETPAQPDNPQAQTEKQYTATFKITGTYAELKAVSDLLKSNNTAYKVLEQKEV